MSESGVKDETYDDSAIYIPGEDNIVPEDFVGYQANLKVMRFYFIS